MATYNVMPFPKFFAVDATGVPYSGGLLYFYASGTTTPQDSYSDTAGTPNTNPVVLDSAGRATIYLGPRAYSVVLKDANSVTIWTVDPVFGGNTTDVLGTAGGAISSGQVVYLSDGSGSKTAGRWYLADSANTYSSTLPQVGIALGAISSGSVGGIRLIGQLTNVSGLTAGTTYYVGSAGALTSTAPANARKVGVADTTTSIVVVPTLTNASTTEITTTSTGTQNDFAPGLSGHTNLRCNNASLLTINGFAAGVAGQLLFIESVGAGIVALAHQAAGSIAANRLINFATSANTSLAAGSGTACFIYDGTTARWRLLSHDQGAWITPAFSAGNFTGSGSMTVTVAAGDVVTYEYLLNGRTLHINYRIATITVAGTPSTDIDVAIPGGYTSTSAGRYVYFGNDNGTPAAALAQVAASGTVLMHFKNVAGSGNWAGSTDATEVATMGLAIQVN